MYSSTSTFTPVLKFTTFSTQLFIVQMESRTPFRLSIFILIIASIHRSSPSGMLTFTPFTVIPFNRNHQATTIDNLRVLGFQRHTTFTLVVSLSGSCWWGPVLKQILPLQNGHTRLHELRREVPLFLILSSSLDVNLDYRFLLPKKIYFLTYLAMATFTISISQIFGPCESRIVKCALSVYLPPSAACSG